MIRPAEIRAHVTTPGSGYADRQQGSDKHWGKAVCYITVDRNMYWWTRLTVNTGITLRENTDACSPFRQYQIIREDALTIDLESMIPGETNDVAASYLYDFRAGKVITNLHSDILVDLLQKTAVEPTGTVGTNSAYGAFVITRSNVEFSRDDFSSLRITLSSLGYGTNTSIVGVATTYDTEAGFVAETP